jgi:hypothetical protein
MLVKIDRTSISFRDLSPKRSISIIDLLLLLLQSLSISYRLIKLRSEVIRCFWEMLYFSFFSSDLFFQFFLSSSLILVLFFLVVSLSHLICLRTSSVSTVIDSSSDIVLVWVSQVRLISILELTVITRMVHIYFMNTEYFIYITTIY